MGQLQRIVYESSQCSRRGTLQGNKIVTSHCFKQVYAAKRRVSALFSCVTSTILGVGPTIHMVN